MKNHRACYIILTIFTIAVLAGIVYESRLTRELYSRLQTLNMMPYGTPTPVQTVTVTPEATSTQRPEPSATVTPEPTGTAAPTPTGTPTPLPTRIPTPVPEDVVEHEIAEKNISVLHYYKNPELKQELLIYQTVQEGQQIKNVGVALMRDDRETIWLTQEDYRYENSILGIRAELLDTLAEDYYSIRVLLDNGAEGTEVVRIHGEEEDYAADVISSRMGCYDIAAGQYEKLHCVPVNTNGRKITEVSVKQKSILGEDCRLLFDGRAMEFDMAVLEKMWQNEEVPVIYTLDDNMQIQITFTFLEEEWKHPVFRSSNFVVHKETPEDLFIYLDWNGHAETDLQYIGFYGDERIVPAYWYTTKEAVVIKKEFLQSLNAGEYHWKLEFGTVGYYIQVIIQ